MRMKNEIKKKNELFQLLTNSKKTYGKINWEEEQYMVDLFRGIDSK